MRLREREKTKRSGVNSSATVIDRPPGIRKTSNFGLGAKLNLRRANTSLRFRAKRVLAMRDFSTYLVLSQDWHWVTGILGPRTCICRSFLEDFLRGSGGKGGVDHHHHHQPCVHVTHACVDNGHADDLRIHALRNTADGFKKTSGSVTD
jgi:hypothetical protein